MPANKFLKISLRLSWLCLALLTACGQKGPLYLPEQAPPPAQSAAQDPGEPTPDTAAGRAADPLPEPAKADDDQPL
ncbi:MAG TPA: lipoprotein [Xanthomonadales bacterium]|nr:lipoprotein [Xanthomonadales bacterium]